MRQAQPITQAEGVGAGASMSMPEGVPMGADAGDMGREGSESTGTGPTIPEGRAPPTTDEGEPDSVYDDANRRRLNEGETKFTPRFLPDSQPGLIKKGRNRPAVSVVTNFSNSGMESYRRMGVARHRVKTSEEHSVEYGRVADPRARPNVHSLAIGALDNRPKKIITGIRIKT